MSKTNELSYLDIIIIMAKAGCSPDQIALVAEYLRTSEEDEILELYLKAIDQADRERENNQRISEIIRAAFSSKDKWGRT